MDSYENRPQRPVPPTAESARLGLDEAAMDLVLACTQEGHDGVVRTLLRSLVALGLTSAASYWQAAVSGDQPPSGSAWTQYRGFGGATPPPSFDVDAEFPESINRTSSSVTGSTMAFRFGPQGAIVAKRDSFDADGRREQREDELESLILLADTLLIESHDYPASHLRETEGEQGTPGPLPRQFPDQGKGRQAG